MHDTAAKHAQLIIPLCFGDVSHPDCWSQLGRHYTTMI